MASLLAKSAPHRNLFQFLGTMHIGTLLTYHFRARRRQLSGRLGVFLLLSFLCLSLLLLLVGGPILAGPEQTESMVRDRSFWFSALAALIYSYSSFEVFFRAKDRKILAAFYISPSLRYWDLVLRTFWLHLPLLLLPLAYAYGLWAQDLNEAALFSFLFGILLFTMGLSVALALHLYFGESLLKPGSPVKKMLAGATVTEDAAVLIYAPALALLVVLVLGMFLELSLRDAVFRGDAALLALVLALSLALTAFALFNGWKRAKSSLLKILPRFSEIDVLPPYKEDGVRRKVPGEGMASILPEKARPYFLRDLRQLRRRYRLDRILLPLYFLYALKFLSDQPDNVSLFWPALLLNFAASAIFFLSAFRLVGELSAESLENSLRQSPKDEFLGRLVASAIHPLGLCLLSALAVFILGPLKEALFVLLASIPLTLFWLIIAERLAALSFKSKRKELWPLLWRLGIALLVLGIS